MRCDYEIQNVCRTHYLEAGLALCIGKLLNCRHGSLSDLTLRLVDDTVKAKIVGGVVYNAEVSDEILDLLTLEESESAQNSVGLCF